MYFIHIEGPVMIFLAYESTCVDSVPNICSFGEEDVSFYSL